MHVDEDGKILHVSGRFPDVEIEGILADGRPPVVGQRDLVVVIADDLRKGVIVRGVRHLHGHGREVIGGKNAFPGFCRLWLAPSEVAHGRLRVRDAGIDFDLLIRRIDAGQVAHRSMENLCHAAVFSLDRRDRTDRRLRDEEDHGKDGK